MSALHPIMAAALAPFVPPLTRPAQTFCTVRPTDRFMLQVLADGLGITPVKAHEWLYTIDFDGLSDVLIDEARNEAHGESKAERWHRENDAAALRTQVRQQDKGETV